jgi:hypothetical protein
MLCGEQRDTAGADGVFPVPRHRLLKDAACRRQRHWIRFLTAECLAAGAYQ